ncbi:protein kinase domain-containing protein [Streptomyces sp. cg35]|uniref:protein kinase domain-containing protein n=1 Tax=Streptomyces sp. cg35 TaxID=3421650 RepID=UPI003D174AF6
MPPLRSTGPGPEAERPGYAGRYRLEECLGSGGMGVVHLATSASGLRLAIKIVHASIATDPEFRARFRQEVSAARRVSGAFTAPVVDADPDAGLPWMATLFIPGDTLSERVKRNGALTVAEVRRLGAGLAEALRDIHRAGVVHRDLKPSNVLLAADGPKVIDFGISRPVDSDLRTETGRLIGSPPYMAPEQFQRPREVGPAADVFAMGAVLAHAATGRGPFDSDSPYLVAYQVVHNEPDLTGVPDELLPVVRRCLTKDPDERPSPAEVMEMLRQPATAPLIPAQREPDRRERIPEHSSPADAARPVSRPEPGTASGGTVAPRRGRRSRLVLAAAVGTLLIATGAALATGTLFPDDERPAAHRQPSGRADFTPWATRLGTGSGTPPACTATADALYCVTGTGLTARLDPADGAVVWRRALGRPSGAPPTVSGGLLHLVTGHRLQALDLGTGAARWSADTAGSSAVRHSAGTTLLVGSEGAVRALDSATGRKLWERGVGGVGTQWVAGDQRTLYAVTPAPDGSATTIRAVAADDGRSLWSARADGDLRPVAAGDDALHLLSLNADQLTDAVVRLDTRTRSAHRVPLPLRIDQAEATESAGTVFVYGAGGMLLAVDTRPTTKAADAVRWQQDTAVSRPSRPVAAEGRLCFTAPDGRLLATDARTGAPLGQTRPRSAARPDRVVAELAEPVVVGGRVYGSAPDGTVFGVDGRHPEDW